MHGQQVSIPPKKNNRAQPGVYAPNVSSRENQIMTKTSAPQFTLGQSQRLPDHATSSIYQQQQLPNSSVAGQVDTALTQAFKDLNMNPTTSQHHAPISHSMQQTGIQKLGKQKF